MKVITLLMTKKYRRLNLMFQNIIKEEKCFEILPRISITWFHAIYGIKFSWIFFKIGIFII